MRRAEKEKELRAWGMSDDDIKRMLGNDNTEDGGFGVFPENWRVFEVFWRVKHQWHVVVGNSGVFYQGLRYPAVESVLRMLKIDDTEDIFNGLNIMELAAKKVLNED